MLCCLGLFAGYAVGSVLGGPWRFIAPAIGFGLGFVVDSKLMRGMHGGHGDSGGGCCGGGGSGHIHNERRPGCLLCGMGVDKKTAKYKTVFKGSTYYFCSADCQKTFDQNPEKYV